MESKEKLLLAVGVGLILSDIIPTPADALYLYQQRVDKNKLEKGELTPKQFWIRDVAGYYGYNTLWWALIVGASFAIGKNYTQKRNILIGLIAGGAVLAVVSKNIKKDEEFYKTHKIVTK